MDHCKVNLGPWEEAQQAYDTADATPTQFAKDTLSGAPEVDGIDFQLHGVDIISGDVIADVTLNLEDYIRQCIQFDIDIYDALKTIGTSKERMAELVDWVRNTNDFTQARLGQDGTDQWPTRPNL